MLKKINKINNKVKVFTLSVLLLIISATIIIINGSSYVIKFANLDSSYNLDSLIIVTALLMTSIFIYQI